MFGFLALVFGALINFGLNRKRDAALRRDEARAVAAALYGEILLIRDELARVAQAVGHEESRWGPGERYTPHFFVENQVSEPTLYRALAAKIGILDAALNLGITSFHRRAQEIRVWLPRLVKNDPTRPYTYSALYVLDPACDAISEIGPTLRAIEQEVGIATPAPDVDIRDAESCRSSLRDMEEQR